MSAEAVRALEAELGGRAPDGLEALADPQLRSFTDVLHDAKRRQSGALAHKPARRLCDPNGHPHSIPAAGAMSAKAVRALEAELGGRAPDGLEALADPDLRSFTDVLHDAKRRQSEALEAAVEQALEIVPRMVRGPVRKILFG